MKNLKNRVILSAVLICSLIGIAYQNCGQIDSDPIEQNQNDSSTLNLLSKEENNVLSEEIPVLERTSENSGETKAAPAPAPVMGPKPCPKDPPANMKCYSVSGKLYGLNGGTVTLANNGVNLLPLSVNGPFTFTQLLQTGSLYNATVNTQPIGQTCTVYTGAGAIGTANITNVVVKCISNLASCNGQSNKSWYYPNSSQHLGLSSYFGGNHLGLNENLQATVVNVRTGQFHDINLNSNLVTTTSIALPTPANWISTDVNAVGDSITAKAAGGVNFVEKIGGTYSALQSISIPGVNAKEPNVAINNNGDEIITWYDPLVGCFLAHKKNGIWNIPTNASQKINPGTQSCMQPKVSMSKAGNKALIIWEQNNGTDMKIYMSYYNGTNWIHPSSVLDNFNPSFALPMWSPEVSISDNGNHAVVVWDDQTTGRYAATSYMGTWTYPTSSFIIPPGSSPNYDSSVKINNSGNVIVAWDTYPNIWMNEKLNGTWLTPIQINPPNTYTYPTTQKSYDIDLNNYGKAIITWKAGHNDYWGDRYEYKSERASSTAAWVHPANALDIYGNFFSTTFFGAFPRVEIDESCNAVLSWVNNGYVYHAIFK